MPQAQPELKKYMEKRLFVQLNGNRKVIGILRGYDVRASPHSSFASTTFLSLDIYMALYFCSRLQNARVFMNIVLDEAVEEKNGGEKVRLGMVVIRGNSVVMLEVCSPPSRIC
ncbi:hypothetical protein GX50_03750 [[Emmonsia] crescens]|uniref:Small nuclear ribonucleoprotein G n=1 Tax=[Emmonsia] crescens TaxID=73230 RepID=A0A2B7ZJU2_9EURO|nr:hypothetical protein GX50_03750 [Emmonsia crescens]